MIDPVVSIHGLEKRYGRVLALDGVDFEMQPGSVGLLGPNGAGKTTLLKLMLGLLRPDAGQARVAGFDPARRRDRLAVRRAVGYMPEGDCIIPGMTAVDLVATLGRLTGLSRQDAMTRTHEVLDYVGVHEERYRGLEEYSTGMKQRVKLAQALVHDPELLLLDEPTNGLDPKGRREMLALVHDLGHAQAKNVLLCSHLLPDVERTCDRVVVIHRGRVVQEGEIAAMTRADARRVRIEVRGSHASTGAFAQALARERLAFERDGDTRFRVELPDGGLDADAVFGAAAAAGCTVAGLEPVRSSLEEVFLQVLKDAGQVP